MESIRGFISVCHIFFQVSYSAPKIIDANRRILSVSLRDVLMQSLWPDFGAFAGLRLVENDDIVALHKLSAVIC